MEGDKNYKIQKKLGEGAYGAVFKAKSVHTQKYLAIKIIKIQSDDDGIPSTTIREINILKIVNHPNIVKLYNVQFKKMQESIPEVHLCFEYLESDLSKYMKQNQPSIFNCKKIFYQILKGTDYLHRNGIYHRDLKPQNILLANDLTTKIADFGLSRIIQNPGQTLSKEIQTLWYRAPEILLGCEKYDVGVDLWSLGCILFEIVEKEILFQSDCDIGQIFAIFFRLGTPTWPQNSEIMNLPHFKKSFPKMRPTIKECFKKLDQNGIDLVLKFLSFNPQKRISVRDALFHPFFSEVRAQIMMEED